MQFLICVGFFLRSNVVSCAKHFVGDGGTTGGIDESNTVASYKSLRSIHLRPYYDAIAYGVSTIMISYSSWNGVKMSANQYLINHILKQRMGFQVITIFNSNISRFSFVISIAAPLLISIGFHNIGLGGSRPDCHSSEYKLQQQCESGAQCWVGYGKKIPDWTQLILLNSLSLAYDVDSFLAILNLGDGSIQLSRIHQHCHGASELRKYKP